MTEPVRVRVYFDKVDVVLDFRADPYAALQFALTAPSIGCRAVLGGSLEGVTRNLPCERLWL
jgi:hypothetical protein